MLVEACGIQTLICGLNLEGTNGDEQYDPLAFSSPHMLLSDSGLYIISCELVRHFAASLEKEEVVNKIIIRPKSCATPRGWDVLLNAIRGGRGDLCCSVVFSSIKGWERDLPHM